MRKRGFLCFIPAILFLLPPFLWAGTATVQWQVNPETDLKEYKVYHGTASRSYGTPLPVGKVTSYTFNNLAEGVTHYFTVTSVDTYNNESGYSAEVSKYVSASDTQAPQVVISEFGETSVSHSWRRVTIKGAYSDPVVVAAPLSYNGGDPSVVRIRNLTPTGFEIRLQEWDYLDGFHTSESVGYLIMERGSYTLGNGTRLEAGRFAAGNTNSFKVFGFNGTFAKKPVVIPSVSTLNGTDAVTCRVRNISTTGFELRLQKEEADLTSPVMESVSYVAWEPSSGSTGDAAFEVSTTGDVVTNTLTRISYKQTFTKPTMFIAAMQTFGEGDTAALRYRNKTSSGVEVKVEEEKSRDAETSHTMEVVGYIVFSGNNPTVASIQ